MPEVVDSMPDPRAENLKAREERRKKREAERVRLLPPEYLDGRIYKYSKGTDYEQLTQAFASKMFTLAKTTYPDKVFKVVMSKKHEAVFVQCLGDKPKGAVK